MNRLRLHMYDPHNHPRRYIPHFGRGSRSSTCMNTLSRAQFCLHIPHHCHRHFCTSWQYNHRYHYTRSRSASLTWFPYHKLHTVDLCRSMVVPKRNFQLHSSSRVGNSSSHCRPLPIDSLRRHRKNQNSRIRLPNDTPQDTSYLCTMCLCVCVSVIV